MDFPSYHELIGGRISINAPLDMLEQRRSYN